MDPLQVRLTIDSKLRHVSLLGTAVQRMCLAAGFDDAAAGQAELCVVEAVNNAIEHAYHGRGGHPVEVTMTVRAETVDFEIADRGEPMAPGRLETAAPPADPLAERGRGLHIIRSLMDEVAYRSANGRNVLTMRKRRAPTATGAAVQPARSESGPRLRTPRRHNPSSEVDPWSSPPET